MTAIITGRKGHPTVFDLRSSSYMRTGCDTSAFAGIGRFVYSFQTIDPNNSTLLLNGVYLTLSSMYAEIMGCVDKPMVEHDVLNMTCVVEGVDPLEVDWEGLLRCCRVHRRVAGRERCVRPACVRCQVHVRCAAGQEVPHHLRYRCRPRRLLPHQEAFRSQEGDQVICFCFCALFSSNALFRLCISLNPSCPTQEHSTNNKQEITSTQTRTQTPPSPTPPSTLPLRTPTKEPKGYEADSNRPLYAPSRFA